jgi:flagellar motor switch protein FliM
MLLHRLVDRALAPLLEPMTLEHATEGYLTIDRADLDALVATGDPQAVLAGFGGRAVGNGLMVAEPSLSSTVLSRIWRSDRNQGAPLTHVEGEILRQFLARIVGSWAESWMDAGIRLIPEFTMAGSLSVLQPQLANGRWHIARTIVREAGETEPVGVLLFCYPDALLPQLAQESRSTMWRARIERGLTEPERMRLADRLSGPLREVAVTAPVVVRQHMTLGMLNSLERGDVVAFDTDAEGAIALDVLGRDVTGILAAHGEHLALALTGPDDPGATSGAPPEPMQAAGAPVAADVGLAYEQPPEAPVDSWDLAG